MTFNYVPTLLVAEFIPGTKIDDDIFEWDDFYELSEYIENMSTLSKFNYFVQ